jgi:hypothetical protein
LDIGLANLTRLNDEPIDWALAVAKNMMRSHRYQIPRWIRDVYGPAMPNIGEDVQIFGFLWEAPGFLVMVPSRHRPWNP